ncbi:MAG: hypothetical protein MPJ50_13540 [Pirellulales bacterium]|nr:hypothetical protein [Pirellulales bacterium]
MSLNKCFSKLLFAVLASSLCAAQPNVAWGQDRAVYQDGSANQTKQEELEKKFQELLSGSKFVGRYTVSEDLNEKPKADEYHIQSVTKVEVDKWRFVARVKYGNVDLNVPMVLSVKWAGDSPVITLDELSIPGLGTFSARVVIHGNKYAASWDGGDHGGFMWGKIEKTEGGAKATSNGN